MHAALEEGRAFALHVVTRGGDVVVQVVAEVERLLVEAAARHERGAAQHDAVLLVDPRHAQAQPLVKERARADVLADARGQALERALAALAREPRQRARPALAVAQVAARGPDRGELRAERHLGHGPALRRAGRAQALHVLAVHSGEQRHAAVGGRPVLEAEIAHRDLDVDLLQQVGEHRVGDALRREQAHQRLQQASQGGDEGARRCHLGATV